MKPTPPKHSLKVRRMWGVLPSLDFVTSDENEAEEEARNIRLFYAGDLSAKHSTVAVIDTSDEAAVVRAFAEEFYGVALYEPTLKVIRQKLQRLGVLPTARKGRK